MANIIKAIYLPLLLAAMAQAAVIPSTSLSAQGGTGDACTGSYAAEEGFSYSNSASTSPLQYSAMANGYSNASGCANSGIISNISVFGSANYGVLKASATAGMTSFGAVQSADNIGVGYWDSFYTAGGGTFQLTFNLNDTISSSPSCVGNNPQATLQYGFGIYGQAGSIFEEAYDASWNRTDCNPTAGPYQTYGNVTVENNNTVQVTFTLGAGSTFEVNSSLTAFANVGAGQTATVDAADTAILDIVALNGATYTSASGVTYDATDAPEPGFWLPAGLALGGFALWRRLSTR